MDKTTFIKQYCKNSNIEESKLLESHVVLPCNCNNKGCKSWALVSNNKLSIKAHNDLYAPKKPSNSGQVQNLVNGADGIC